MLAPKALKLHKVKERLHLERHISLLLPELFGFLTVVVLFCASMKVSVPVGDMSDIRENLEYHFKLEDVAGINTFQGIYTFLYQFVEACERFDPLDTERYVDRTYLDSNGDVMKDFNNSAQSVLLRKNRRFYAITAVLVRPQVWMSRAKQVPCKHFSLEYDRLYSLARYFRGKYRGFILEGGWAPQKVFWSNGPKNVSKLLSMRTPSVSPPAQESDFLATDEDPAEYKSDLLMCIAHEPFQMNGTMRRKLVTEFRNVATKISGVTYFGSFSIDQTDILNYMGYEVNVNDIDTTRYPQCFMTSKRDADGRVTHPKVTDKDVDERCEKTADTWHDALTHEIMAQVILYTPEVEIFTRITVSWKQKQAGVLKGTYELVSAQSIRHCGQRKPFLVLGVVQLVACAIQMGIISWRFHKELEHARTFPSVFSCGSGEKMSFLFGMFVQLCFITVIIFGIVFTETLDVWNEFQDLLTRNPYYNKEAADATTEAQNKLDDFFTLQLSYMTINTVLMAISMGQIIYLLKVHPNMGLVPNVMIQVAEDLAHFLVIFMILFFLVSVTGHFAFGAFISDFSSLMQTCVLAFSFSLGAFDLSKGAEKLPGESYKYLLMCWEVATLFIIFLALLNFLLAIVVDGYAAIHDAFADDCANSFLLDIYYLIRSQLNYKCRGWIRRPRILEYLAELPPEKTILEIDDICVEELFGSDAGQRQLAEHWFSFYSETVPDIDASEKIGSPEDEKEVFANLTSHSDLDGRLAEITEAFEKKLAEVAKPDHSDLDRKLDEITEFMKNKVPEAEKAELLAAAAMHKSRADHLETELLKLKEYLHHGGGATSPPGNAIMPKESSYGHASSSSAPPPITNYTLRKFLSRLETTHHHEF